MIDPRHFIIWLGLGFFATGVYYRIQSGRTKESLDRRQEGWVILLGLRLAGLASLVCTIALLSNPALFAWAAISLPEWTQWCGVICFALAELWLIWMFRSLGRNLTDTVVTRANATLVESGPYRYVRNPMYTGMLMLGLSLGVALGTWLPPALVALVFAFMAFRTPIEERYLIERFGDQYRDYMRRTGRFFPRHKKSGGPRRDRRY